MTTPPAGFTLHPMLAKIYGARNKVGRARRMHVPASVLCLFTGLLSLVGLLTFRLIMGVGWNGIKRYEMDRLVGLISISTPSGLTEGGVNWGRGVYSCRAWS